MPLSAVCSTALRTTTNGAAASPCSPSLARMPSTSRSFGIVPCPAEARR
jgi:hypothetical protein